ncbi:SRPBCC family protein [bacterium]|nr:SRPBCC family protein [bacterium]
MGIYKFEAEQLLNADLDELWDFISSPANLKKITPPSMGFDITSGDLPEKMYEGMMISYIVKPLAGIPMTWLTEITHVQDREFFVDEQRSGPYTIWHHEHHLIPTEKGVLMKDIITYKPPFGILGSIANGIVVRPKIKQIFEYRKKVLEKEFNGNSNLQG